MRFSTSLLFMLSLTLAAPALQAQVTVTSGGTPSPITLDGHLQRQVVTATSPTQGLHFFNLLPGETYLLLVPEDESLNGCRPTVTASTGADGITYQLQNHQVTFKATAKEADFTLEYPCTWDAANPPRHYLSLLCQTCKKAKLKDYLESMATLETQGGGSAEDLVKDILIGGNCFDVTNVTYSGNGGQIGTFSNGTTNIGFNTGMIMATGDVSVAVGPNDQDNASAGYGTSGSDSDLSSLANGGATFDVANIEFDFTPTQTPLTFDYVFASEEYCEYVGSQFNDVFGFFISGPGISGPFGGAANIAVVGPGTYVAINNVNHLSNTGLYVNNQPSSSSNLCGQTASSAPATNEVQFDGFTRKLTAVANVQPCQTYHIKLKVCDIGDGIFDSAVFLKAGSFDGGGNASVEFLVNGEVANETYEGCGTVQLHFQRVGGNPNQPISVQYTILGTATNGTDYTGVPGSVIIPSGQTEVFINVNILVDQLLEGSETLIIKLANACSCLEPQEVLTIIDLPVLNAMVDTVTICGPGVGVLTATPIGGVDPYTYKWSFQNTTEPSISPYVATSTNYTVTITDACGKTVVRSGRIIVNPPPVAQLLPPAPQLCPGQSATLMVNFTGAGPFTLDYNFNGDPQTITDITDDPYALTVNAPGLYQVTSVTDAAGCTGPGQGSLLVTESALTMTAIVTNVKCNGQNNGSINTTVTGGQGPYNYAWTGPQTIGNVADPNGLQAGDYTVTVTDGFGCTQVNTYTVVAPSAIVPTIANVQPVNCTNPNGGSIDLNVSGGSPAFTYKWSNMATVQDPNGLAQGTYTVTITDQNQCTKTTTATVPGDFAAPTAVATAPAQLTCTATSVTLNGTGSSAGNNFTYNWAGPAGGIVSGGTTLSPVVNLAGTYTLTVKNTANGCTSTATAVVTANNTLPTAAAGPDQTLTCVLTNATLNGAGSSVGPTFSYNWTATGGGTIISGGTTLNPIASTTGTYTLVVTNSQNGCTKSDVVVVTSNTAAPVAVVTPPAQLSCISSNVTLNGSGSTPAGGLTFQWTTTTGAIQSGQTSANAVVNEPGQYTLIVTNSANGCTNSKTVTVTQDYAFPLAIAAVPPPLTCVTSQVTLNGDGSSIGGVFAFNWTTTGGTIVSGGNTLHPVVSAAGTYVLAVTNTQNGCSSVESVQVVQDVQPPLALAGSPNTLNCLVTSVTLGDTSLPTTPNFVYNWTTSGSGSIVSGSNTPMPVVNGPGTYNLAVTNATNGCSSSASVVIAQNITNPTAIVAPGGELNCVTPAVLLNGNGSSTGANFVYDWTSSTGGGIGAGANTLTPTVTASGTYTLLITNTQNGCTAQASTSVTSNANLPTVLVAQPQTFTCTNQQIALDGAGSTTGPTITYQWGTVSGSIISGQGTLNAVAGAPGTYTLVVTNTANNCTSTFSVDVPADIAAPTASAGPGQTLDCTVPAFTLDGSASSQGANFSYQWTAVSGGNFVSPTDIISPQVNEAGTYQLVVTNTQNGCTAASSVDIIKDANDPVVQIAQPGILNCANSQQLTLSAAGSTSGPGITYAWNGPAIASGGSTLNAVVTQPGNYTLVITNATNGCTSEQTVPVDIDVQAPPADAGPDNILNCYTPQQQIGGAGNPTGNNYTFLWTGTGIVSGANTATPVIDQGGLFNLVVTNTDNGCTATDAVNIATDFAAPQAESGPTFQLTCAQNTYTMAATGSTGANFVYEWTTNGGSFASPSDILTPTVDAPGQYYLLVTNTTNGCTATDDVQITKAADVPTAAIAIPAPLTCATTSLTLNGAGSSTGPEFQYQWMLPAGSTGNIVSGDTTLNPVVNEPGMYTLAVTNTTNNCITYSSIVVAEDVAAPVMDAGTANLLTCTNTSISLQGSVTSNGTFTYQWQGQNGGSITAGATTLTPTVNATGDYLLTVTNTQNGCTSTDQVNVQADQVNPVAVIQQPGQLTCAAGQVTIDATGSSTGTMQYAWTTTNGHFVTNSGLQPVVDQPGTYQLLVTDTDNGCTAVTTAQVDQDVTLPTAQAGNDDLITCATTSVQLDGSNSSQGGNYFYQWTTTDGQILVGANTLTPTVIAGGTYTLVVVNNDNGCQQTDQALVTTNTTLPTVSVAAPGVITCTQSQVPLVGTSSPSGPGISYSWTTTNGNILSGQSAATATVSSAGNYTLAVLNTNNGCASTTSVDVTQNIVLPLADAGPPATLTCSLAQITLQGNGSTGSIYSYVWTTPNGQIISGNTSLSPVVNQPGAYTLTVSNLTTGCTQTDEVDIFKETNVPTGFEYTLVKPGCKDNDGSITFNEIEGGVGPYVYSIDNGDNFTASVDFAAVQPGQYDLLIQDVNGCEFHQPLTVPAAPDPAVTLTPDVQISLGDSLTLNATLPQGYLVPNIADIIWTPLAGLDFKDTTIIALLHPGVKPFKTTEYTITVISKDGCQASDRILIRVDNEPHIYIPNAFSPWHSGDVNDVFYISADGDQIKGIRTFAVYDRWGEMMFVNKGFQPNDPKQGWDGRLGGKLMDPAVFAYVAEIELIDGRVLLYKGDVTLVR